MVTPITGEYESIIGANDPATLVREIRRNIVSSLGDDPTHPGPFRVYRGLVLAIRDRLVDTWIGTQRSYYDAEAKRVYYLSMEFLPGRLLRNALLNLGLLEAAENAVRTLGFPLEEIEEQEWDPGLGNGGLGRLASCYLSSMASLGIPGYGYGIRYDYGIFYQLIRDGYQVERPDHWLRFGDPWSLSRPEHLFEVKFYGRVEQQRLDPDRLQANWVDTNNVMGVAYDLLIPGFRNSNVINMRLWSARSSREVDLDYYNRGDYIGAVESKVSSENISRVLYPSEAVRQGKELRLRQEYFFVCATFQDIMRRFKKKYRDFDLLPQRVAVQLNDTHPAIAIAELMRLLVDEEHLEWDRAWDLCVRTFAYTNHTVLPEALETWSVELLERVLPRHLQIIYEVNQRFLDRVIARFPGDVERMERVSLISEGPEKRVRMAHLAIVGSHSVNGVSALHSHILKDHVFKELAELFPDRFTNRTNGVDHRRFLLQANPQLAALLTEAIGDGWMRDLDQLRALERLSDDAQLQVAWRRVRQQNKERLATWLQSTIGAAIDPDSLLDIQVKRLHEYKRQLLNVLHVITLYNRLREGQQRDSVPRTVIIGGKAAPSYWLAKLIIKLIHSVADVVSADPHVRKSLRLLFLPNYGVSAAERLVGACDLSEQISTAGMEASGTGNMKFALNGAQIIGTLDGANIEIMEEIGEGNLFIFGLNAQEVRRQREGGYNPRAVIANDPDLSQVIDQITSGHFSPSQPDLFRPVVEPLLAGDYFMVLADYRSYVQCQERATSTYLDVADWTRRSISTVARMGFFSSDRAIREYADKTWDVRPQRG